MKYYNPRSREAANEFKSIIGDMVYHLTTEEMKKAIQEYYSKEEIINRMFGIWGLDEENILYAFTEGCEKAAEGLVETLEDPVRNYTL